MKPIEIDLLTRGRFTDRSGVNVEYDDAYLDTLATSTNEFIEEMKFRPPVGLAHERAGDIPTSPKVGELTRFRAENGRLMATYNAPDDATFESVKPYFDNRSVEIWNDASRISGVSDTVRDTFKGRPVLRRLALLGADIPAVKGLSPLSDLLAAYSEYDGDIIELTETAEHNKQAPEGGDTAGEGEALTVDDRGTELSEKQLDQLEKLTTELGERDKKIQELEAKAVRFEEQAEANKSALDSALTSIAELKNARSQDANTAVWTRLLEEGKVEPKEKDSFLIALSAIPENENITVTLSEGETKELSKRTVFLSAFEDRAPRVDFQERIPGGKGEQKRVTVPEGYDSDSYELDQNVRRFAEEKEIDVTTAAGYMGAVTAYKREAGNG